MTILKQCALVGCSITSVENVYIFLPMYRCSNRYYINLITSFSKHSLFITTLLRNHHKNCDKIFLSMFTLFIPMNTQMLLCDATYCTAHKSGILGSSPCNPLIELVWNCPIRIRNIYFIYVKAVQVEHQPSCCF